jgi:osmotically-inducible protein OsmY
MSQDSKLQKSVLAELEWEPSVVAAHLGVTANEGVVVLSGHVDTYPQKHAAEMAVRRVKGVLAVADEIEVRLPVESARSDESIAAAAIERLSWDSTVPADTVLVTVEAGWVTLSGVVDWYYQKDAAQIAVRPLIGVTGVTNQVTIKPRVDIGGLSDTIVHALRRSWFFDPKAVNVSATGGVVRLTGNVHTPHERDVAAAAAWAAPGAVYVENDIRIN